MSLHKFCKCYAQNKTTHIMLNCCVYNLRGMFEMCDAAALCSLFCGTENYSLFHYYPVYFDGTSIVCVTIAHNIPKETNDMLYCRAVLGRFKRKRRS